jgi:hypothetical protein
VVTILQAFHWLDAPHEGAAALAECARLLARPAGSRESAPVLAVAWNVRDLRVPWVSELEALLERYNPAYRRELRQVEGAQAALTQVRQLSIARKAFSLLTLLRSPLARAACLS